MYEGGRQSRKKNRFHLSVPRLVAEVPVWLYEIC